MAYEKNTPIKDLSIKNNIKYNMTINKVYSSCMSIYINGKSYFISIPKNDTWYDVKINNGLKCQVIKQTYYSNGKEYGKLELCKVISNNKNSTTKKYSNYSSVDREDPSLAEWVAQANLTRGWD